MAIFLTTEQLSRSADASALIVSQRRKPAAVSQGSSNGLAEFIVSRDPHAFGDGAPCAQDAGMMAKSESGREPTVIETTIRLDGVDGRDKPAMTVSAADVTPSVSSKGTDRRPVRNSQ
jgi:hypothetical protein